MLSHSSRLAVCCSRSDGHVDPTFSDGQGWMESGVAMMNKTIGLGCVAALMALMVACGDDDASTSSGDPGSGGAGNTANGGSGGAGTGAGGGGPECAEPEPSHGDDMGAIDSITVQYIDQDGAAAANVQTTICGTNICSTPENSDAGGEVTVDASEIDMFNHPRFNSGHNAFDYAKLSGFIPSATHDFGTVRVIRMPGFDEGVAMAAGSAATQGGVTLTIEAGADIAHSLVDYPEENQRRLRGAVVDITGWTAAEMPQVDQGLGIELLVVAMPLGTHICPGAEMSFDNLNDWPAGTEVDIYINGAKTFKHYAPYGGWAKVSEGVVSADANTVVTKEGMGIESLGTFGIVPK